MPEARRGTLVIGLGSPLMADDGIGLAALARLRDSWEVDPAVELVDGGTWGMNLLPMMEAADTVIFLDAIHLGVEPGTVIELMDDEVPRRLKHKLSPHQIDLSEVLAVSSLRGTLPRLLVAIGIEPSIIELGTELSPTARAALPGMLERVAARLEALGHRCTRPAAGVGVPLACTS